MAKVAVAFRRPLEKTYTYTCEDLGATLWRRVVVPLGRSQTMGYAVPALGESEGDFELKPVSSVLDSEPIFSSESWDQAKWLAQHCLCGPGEALSLWAPFGNFREAKKPRVGKKNPPPLTPLPREPLVLNDEQAAAVAAIEQAGPQKGTLLQGVTGSGKTWVYAELIRRELLEGRQVILAVPEISLTPQVESFFTGHFGARVAVIHSRIGDSTKYRTWRAIQKGEVGVVLGARSALFAPLARLGLIILDEEHEGTYKNQQVPRYHSRTVAQRLAQAAKARLIFGSATPSMESRYQTETGRLRHVRLNLRHHGAMLPEARVLTPPRSPGVLLPEAAVRAMDEERGQGRQVLVYLNKRGYARSLHCPECGWHQGCPRCSVNLTWHRSRDRSECHYCGYHEITPKVCPTCRHAPLSETGYGTERIEEELVRRLPQARIGRLDSDQWKKAGVGEKVLGSFHRGDLDLLVGTQVITKGHDFSKVNLVVILYPENLLSMPDFRASERAFSQITQVSGRSGRREERGQVIVVSDWGQQSAIALGCAQDYEGFYQREREVRRLFGWPPFARVMRLVVRGPEQEIVSARAAMWAEASNQHLTGIAQVLGPAPCLLEKVKNHWRHQVVYKIADLAKFQHRMGILSVKFRSRPPLYEEWDMDPVDML